jgi:hypothetical protein
MTASWDIAPCTASIALMAEVVRTFETSVCFYETTRHHIPEGFNLCTCRCENLKSHKDNACLGVPASLVTLESASPSC